VKKTKGDQFDRLSSESLFTVISTKVSPESNHNDLINILGGFRLDQFLELV